MSLYYIKIKKLPYTINTVPTLHNNCVCCTLIYINMYICIITIYISIIYISIVLTSGILSLREKQSLGGTGATSCTSSVRLRRQANTGLEQTTKIESVSKFTSNK